MKTMKNFSNLTRSIRHAALPALLAAGMVAAVSAVQIPPAEPNAGYILSPGLGLAAGRYHSVAVLPDGRIVAWGDNADGQLGSGTIGSFRDTMAFVPGPDGEAPLANVVAAAAGEVHTAAVLADGTVLCWGGNGQGQLGNDSNVDAPLPVPVVTRSGSAPLGDVAKVAAGDRHTLALTSEGKVFAWGKNASGQLGTGTNKAVAAATPVLSPAGSAPLTGVREIAAGGSHSLALTEDGTVLAWGANAQGQLGDGSNRRSDLPVAVADPDGAEILSGIVAVAAGGDISLAIREDGTILMWGADADAFADPAKGKKQRTGFPVRVVDRAGSPLTDIAAIAAGDTVCAAVKSDGSVWIWGKGAARFFGTPADDDDEGEGLFALPTVLPLPDTEAFPHKPASVAVGREHLLLAGPGMRFLACGSNDCGQFGTGNTTAAPAPILIDGDLDLLSDAWEMLWFGTLATDPEGDPDTDRITNYGEYLAFTDPTFDDTPPEGDNDGDGMTNGWEKFYGLDRDDPSDARTDLDGDGLSNLAEFQAGTDPTRQDTDFDGIPDLYELEMGFNPALPSFDSFLGFWKFDEAAGPIAFDVSLLANHAELDGPVRALTPDNASVLVFDGADDAVLLPAEPARASDTFTLTVRFKVGAPYGNAVADPARDGEMTLLDLPGGTPEETIRLYKTPAHALALSIGGRQVAATPDTAVLPGEWYQATAVVDPAANITRLHVNGLEVDAAQAAVGLSAEAGTFGSDAAGAAPFAGAIDLVCFLNQAMTVEEVALLDEPFADPDGDGLANVYEYGNQSSPFNPDSDGDTISDLDELRNGTSPINADTDGDGLDDAAEYAAGTDPLNPDTDMDGLLDGWEVANAMDPLDAPGSLLAWWPFDETEGQTAEDRGPGGFDAALTGTSSEPSALANARVFDGSGDNGRTAAAPAFAGGEFSVLCRVRFDKLYGNTVVGNAEDGTMTVTALQDADGNSLLALSLTPRHSIRAELRDPQTGETVVLESPDAFALPDQWYTVAVVLHRPALTLVVDGVPAASAGCDHAMDWTPASVRFASSGSPDDGLLAGALDDHRFYGKALDGSDLAVLAATTDDTDGDGYAAYVESIHGTSPDSLDSDQDGLSDADEIAGLYGTDPANYDSDSDGMADGWELAYGFNPLDNSEMLEDPDGDLLTNIEEYLFGANPLMADTDGDSLSDYDEVYVHGTDPAKADTDGDGQPDAWELAEGTDPFTPDGTADQDGDGLSNEAEYALGTDPAEADTDGDGVDDYEEVKLARSNPLVADFDGTSTLVADIPGSAYTASAGNWTRSGFTALADTRGSVDYAFSGDQTGMFRVAVTGEHVTRTVSCSDARPVDRSNLLLYVDGLYLGRHVLIAPDGVPGTLVFYTPRLATGVHTIRVEWENVHRKTTFRIHSVVVTLPGGTDVNGDNVADWQTNSLLNVTSLEIGPGNGIGGAAGSYISPVCLEGRTRFVELLGLQAAGVDVPVNAGAGERWFANVALDPAASVAVAADFQNGARKIQSQIAWLPYPLLDGGSITLRAGDALRLDGRPAGAASGTADISINGVVLYPAAAGPVAHTFAAPGTYQVSAAFRGADGTLQNGAATVSVIAGYFPSDRYVLLAGRPRQWNCPAMNEAAIVEGDQYTTVVSEGFYRTVTAREVEGRRTLVARAGANGPILDSADLDTFLLQAAVDGYLWHVETYDDGTQLWRQEVFERHLPDDVEIRIHVFVAGATLDDLTIDRSVYHADFNAIGQYDFGLLSPTSLAHSTCHFIRAYHNGQPVGEAYYNRYLLPAQ